MAAPVASSSTRMAYASTGCATRTVLDGERPDPLAGLPGTPVEMLGNGWTKLAALALVGLRSYARAIREAALAGAYTGRRGQGALGE